MKWLLVALLKGYRLVVSPLYGQTCRYYPSCSAYALTAVERHGALKGSWLALRRLGRCHPWCAGGVDLVPAVETYRWWGRASGTEGESEGQAGMTGGAPASSMSSTDAPIVLRGV